MDDSAAGFYDVLVKFPEESTDVVTLAFPATPGLAGAQNSSCQCDRELVNRAKEGDRHAFFQLFETYGSRVYSLSLRRVGNVAVAERLTRDIFIEAFRGLDAIGDDIGFSKWLDYSAAKALVGRKQSRGLTSTQRPTQSLLTPAEATPAGGTG